MTHTIDFPTETKWFITYPDETKEVVMSYGEVTPDETMTTGQLIMDEYDDETQWAAVLIEHEINPYPNEA
jgi:hypothetical protein